MCQAVFFLYPVFALAKDAKVHELALLDLALFDTNSRSAAYPLAPQLIDELCRLHDAEACAIVGSSFRLGVLQMLLPDHFIRERTATMSSPTLCASWRTFKSAYLAARAVAFSSRDQTCKGMTNKDSEHAKIKALKHECKESRANRPEDHQIRPTTFPHMHAIIRQRSPFGAKKERTKVLLSLRVPKHSLVASGSFGNPARE